MPSKKPKIQGVVDPALYQAFIEWKEEHGISSDGEALATMICVYIMGEYEVPTGDNPNALGVMFSNLRAKVEALSSAVEALKLAREQEYSQLAAKINYLSTAVAQMKESRAEGSRSHTPS